jgi:hypothetical protein
VIEDNGSSSPVQSVRVYTVATNQYLEYWQAMAISANEHLFPGCELALTVFTDRADEAEAFASKLNRIRLDIRVIEPLRWPEATLLRYRLIDQIKDSTDTHLSMHLDADMVIMRPVGPELAPRDWTGGIALVRHPSFYRTPRSYIQLSRNPRKLLSELKNRFEEKGPFGSWEHTRESAAFVPRSLRRSYVCGGVWLGRSPEFFDMVSLLAKRVQFDLDNQIIAKWHDESHLNWYAAHHNTSILSPEYCSTDETERIHALRSRIVAVDKGSNRSR